MKTRGCVAFIVFLNLLQSTHAQDDQNAVLQMMVQGCYGYREVDLVPVTPLQSNRYTLEIEKVPFHYISSVSPTTMPWLFICLNARGNIQPVKTSVSINNRIQFG